MSLSRRLIPALVAPGLLALSLCLALAPLATANGNACPDAAPGQWQATDGTPLGTPALLSELAAQRVVLLGEQHDRLAHHRWQLHTLAGLHAHQPDLVIGLEMLPREAQPALDAWIAGELDEAAFLEASDWHRHWGFDPGLYLPILHFARMHRIPLLALNVTPALRQRLAGEGWDAVPSAERHAITPPAAPPAAYREALTEVFRAHSTGADSEASLESFIAAQLVWDRAMATALAEASGPGRLVVGLMGQGHLRHGHGVPHQLYDLGIAAQRRLLPWSAADCEAPPRDLADALFLLGDEAPFEPTAPPRLGLWVDGADDGVRVQGIGRDSVAEGLGLEVGDIILRAAGQALRRPSDLTALVSRQPPGSLMPLEIRRDGSVWELLARFPSASE
ncbi:ChaN family lipoprotein [Halomonas salifodinae]|uniref:ChaN family lipoprotein n=1 Tax=Halomonas salifodinae TaxID=438745 RepID=A0ABW2F1H1_9GAMM